MKPITLAGTFQFAEPSYIGTVVKGHKNMNFKKLLLLACLFLGVVLVGCNGPVSLQTYTGNGYTIGYPQDWASTSQGKVIDFYNQDNTARFAIEIDDNTQGASADSIIDTATQNANAAANLTNIQQHPMSATVQFAGETWLQRAFDGTNANGVNITIDYLLTNHGTGSSMKVYIMALATTVDSFDQSNNNFFQPMLKSFVFTS